MNSNTTSQYMDKQIMDLSNSQSNIASNNASGGADFIDFMNRPANKKENMVPSYDFMPIRPTASSSPKGSNFDSDNDDPPLRTWNSLDSKTNSSSIRNYNSLDVDDPLNFVMGRNHNKSSNAPSDGSLVSDVERMMMKHMDTLMHAIDNVSLRLSQLETKTGNLEHSIDDMKMSVGNNRGTIDGKMRHLENVLTEVHSDIKLVKDKQEIIEAQMQIAKLQIPKAEQVESKIITSQHDSTQTVLPSLHQFSSAPQMPAPQVLPPSNAPPPPPQQNIQSQFQNPNQSPPVPQRDSYFPPPSQTPENQNQQYQLPQMPPQQLAAPPLPQHYQPPPPPQYPQPPPPSQPHSSCPPMGHHPEETLQMPPQNYSMGTRPTPSVPPSGVPPPPSQQYYGPTPNVYEPPPTSRPGSGYTSSFGPPSGHGEPYPYGSSPSQYGPSSPMKQQQLSSSIVGQSGGSGYQQLPTARILPQALPTASAVSGGGGGSGSGAGNRVPIDDVVDRVTNMGFSRDQVRATVRKLTENGQAVDLNIVLDKLMNEGDGQGPRNWFGR